MVKLNVFITRNLFSRFFKKTAKLQNFLPAKMSDNKVDFQRLKHKNFSSHLQIRILKKEQSRYTVNTKNKVPSVIVRLLCSQHNKKY